LLNAYATLPGKTKWSKPHHTTKMLHFVSIPQCHMLHQFYSITHPCHHY
jgi:hypothetical protein